MADNSMSKRVTSFFTAYFQVRNNVLEDKGLLASSEYVLLVKAVDNYLDSLVWAKDKVDSNIYFLTKRGEVGKQIASALNIPIATYRTRVSRITKFLNQALFDGKDAYCIVELSPAELSNMTVRIRHLGCVVDISKITLSEVYNFINEQVNCVEAATNPSESDIFAALLFMTMFSKSQLNMLYKRVKPEVLRYIVDELDKKDGSVIAEYYKGVSDFISNINLNSTNIEKVKKAIGG